MIFKNPFQATDFVSGLKFGTVFSDQQDDMKYILKYT